ncbi:MAG: DUF262 domain-containing protein [Clostridia bacterium]|nr:DUF262 domain-containing protein [Clostridia bacterium]
MEINPTAKTIKELFLSGRKFVIPRFQREYCWNKEISKSFLWDILKQFDIQEGEIKTQVYFLGTMLFIGDYYDGTEDEIYVVDGQQRLTTITILFSAISDKFMSLNQETLSKEIFKYIMTTNDNGEEVRILRSNTHYPYFAYYIQLQKKEYKVEACTEEEKNIFEIYNLFSNLLEEETMKKELKKRYDASLVDRIEYIDLLKALRDQVLKCIFVSISTKEKQHANEIFEILNSKGKQLKAIDIIKNDIFSILQQEEPVDMAEDKWKKIKEILNSKNEHVEIEVFFRHFWISKYKKVSQKSIVDEFKRTIKTEEECTRLLDELIYEAKNYIKILNPNREDYSNKKQYYWLVQSLKCIGEFFNIVQVRIVLLALFYLKDNELIDMKEFKKTINFLEYFHFIYNSVCSFSTNKLEKIYSVFSVRVRNCKNKIEVVKTIRESLIDPLKKILPKYEDFEVKFIELSYSKKENVSNVKTKYAINKINCILEGKEIFEDECNIEHIIPENEEEITKNIGNLILLEMKLNGEADDKKYQDKIECYKKTKLNWVLNFIRKYPNWERSYIESRAKEMAKILYDQIKMENIV